MQDPQGEACLVSLEHSKWDIEEKGTSSEDKTLVS